MTEGQLDLRELARDRTTAPQTTAYRRPYISRYLVPAAVLLGFVALLAVAVGDQLMPRKPVTVVPVVVARAEVRQEGSPLFQAAGWVEPRPTPVHVAALTEGIIQELLVVEGQEVTAGQPIAQLVDTDARLALRQSEAERQLRQAELQSVEAELKAARLRMENPVHLQAVLAEAQSALAQTETAIAQIPYKITSAEARLEYAKQNLQGKESAALGIAGRLIQQAHSEYADAEAELQELKQRRPRLQREADALRDRVAALNRQLELLIDESREVEDAVARREAARARLQAAELAVEKSRLAVQRTTVRSPVAGRVLRLVAAPGTRVMGMDPTSEHSSSTVVTMYDPQMLQVRADVRLEDVPLVQPGQPVEIETASSKEPIRGSVLLATSSANIQKNTLEVKVAILDPPPTIRPEMLVTATFLAPPRSEGNDDAAEQHERLLIPRQLVQSGPDGAAVWIVAPDGTARLQRIEQGRAGTEELVEVTEGIHPTDRLIAAGQQGLRPGDRVLISGEDATLGVGRQ